MITRFFKSNNQAPVTTSANLIICVPGKDPVHYVLNADEVEVGRSKSNAIRINEEWVSRKHFELKSDGKGNYTFQDVSSLNGSRINGLRIAKSKLKHGDFILIGGRIPAHFMVLPLGVDPDPAMFENNRGAQPIPELQGEGQLVLPEDETTPISVSASDSKNQPAVFRAARKALKQVVVMPVRRVAAML